LVFMFASSVFHFAFAICCRGSRLAGQIFIRVTPFARFHSVRPHIVASGNIPALSRCSIGGYRGWLIDRTGGSRRIELSRSAITGSWYAWTRYRGGSFRHRPARGPCLPCPSTNSTAISRTRAKRVRGCSSALGAEPLTAFRSISIAKPTKKDCLDFFASPYAAFQADTPGGSR